MINSLFRDFRYSSILGILSGTFFGTFSGTLKCGSDVLVNMLVKHVGRTFSGTFLGTFENLFWEPFRSLLCSLCVSCHVCFPFMFPFLFLRPFRSLEHGHSQSMQAMVWPHPKIESRKKAANTWENAQKNTGKARIVKFCLIVGSSLWKSLLTK